MQDFDFPRRETRKRGAGNGEGALELALEAVERAATRRVASGCVPKWCILRSCFLFALTQLEEGAMECCRVRKANWGWVTTGSSAMRSSSKSKGADRRGTSYPAVNASSRSGLGRSDSERTTCVVDSETLPLPCLHPRLSYFGRVRRNPSPQVDQKTAYAAPVSVLLLHRHLLLHLLASKTPLAHRDLLLLLLPHVQVRKNPPVARVLALPAKRE